MTGLNKPHNIHVYPGAGSCDGNSGDHIMISPAFNITYEEVETIANRVCQLVEDFFDEYDMTHSQPAGELRNNGGA